MKSYPPNSINNLHKISVAPMMDCTDKHFRMIIRKISSKALLYTEMIVAQSLIYTEKKEQFLDFNSEEHPLSIQFGGDNPKMLEEAAKMAQDWGYDEINFNVGCPSPRVCSGNFGASLMKDPSKVAKCIESLKNNCSIPVTIKHRIGVDDEDSFDKLDSFVKEVANAGADRFTVHARKAILKGLNPKQNRTIPPLKYDMVRKLKKNNPNLLIEINGGFTNIDQCIKALNDLDGVMIGRAIYHSPYFLADIERDIFNNKNVPTRSDVMEKLIPYIQEETTKGVQLNHIMRHTVGLFHGQNGSRIWKQYLSKNMCIRDADLQKVNHIMDQVKKTYSSSLER